MASTGLSPSDALKPGAFISPTVGNPTEGLTGGYPKGALTGDTVAGVPYATQNPGTDYYRMYNPARRVGAGSYSGPVAIPDNSLIDTTNGSPANTGFNQVMMEISQHFEPMIQISTLQHPRWWHDRIPRSAYTLFNGTVHETRIFRGSLVKYYGLQEWQDIDPYPTATNNPCAALGYDTPTYGWEALSWRGKRAAWGSDPICADQFKFFDQAQQQLAWILAAGAEYGIQMQEVWNRDMFVYQSVAFNRSFIMSSEYTGKPNDGRWFYNPFIKFEDHSADATPFTFGNGIADKTEVKGPFVLIDATVDVEPLNFDILDKVRASLEIRCPDAAVSTSGGLKIFAIAVSHDDVEKYVRGNEEERKLWIEANPQALIKHYDFTTPVFRRWSIVNDGNQIRLKRDKVIQNFTAAEGAKLGMTSSEMDPFLGKAVWVAYPVDPLIASPTRVGVNGTPVPEDNPEYIDAELAIAPIFMNQIFENQFVPAITGLGSGTSFGPAPGLNGKWTWLNIRDRETNPLGNVGNFYGTFEIVPKPNKNVFHAISFLYRRCTTPLPSFCPSENAKINPILKESSIVAESVMVKASSPTAVLKLEDMLKCSPGDQVKVKMDPEDSTGGEASAYTFNESDGDSADFTGYVISTPTARSIEVQFDLTSGKVYGIAKGATVTVVG